MGERLSAYDASLLHFVSELGFGHTGSISLVDGELSFDEFRRDLEAKVQDLPRFRQVPAFVPLNLAYPTWEYDPQFNLSKHIDHVHLDAPGSWQQVLDAAAQYLSTWLPKDRPYWSARLLTGLENNQSAVLFRYHHAIMDGVGAEAFQRVMFEGDAPPIRPESNQAIPALPSASARLFRGLRDNVITGLRVVSRYPANTIGLAQWFRSEDARETFRVRKIFKEAEGIRFPFNTPSCGSINVATTRFLLEDLRAMRRAHDATVNDVLLTIIGRAVQRYAKEHNIETAGKVMKVQIPVNMRKEGEARNMGNVATLTPVPIPLYFENTLDLLKYISEYMRAVKKCRASLATHRTIGAILFCLTPMFAPIVQRWVASVKSQRSSMQPGKKVGAVMIISNVPRRPAPLRIAGRPVTMRYPIGGTTPHIGIGCIAMTCGPWLGITFSINTTGAADIDLLISLIEQSQEELQRAISPR
ncbi:MAG: DUF1298 domain-containing protein [Candidatus Hydrogenedentes bacterium]|nr:DUF1298 domain-containing protein [Candidatus Hydrogenedentota bacterium]